MARFVLMRKFRWARRIIRNLTPVYRQGATLAVDRYYRLYYGDYTENWSDREFVGAMWHEVNHLLRHHPNRLEHRIGELPPGMDPRTVNVAADIEINDDLRATPGITLPPDLFYSDKVGHQAGHAAETHLREFIEEWEARELEEPDPDDYDDYEEDDDGDEYDGPNMPGQSGDSDDGDADEDEDGDGVNAPPSPGPSSQSQLPEETGLDMPECGSGATGQDDPEDLDPPDDKEQARLKREERKLDEDIVEAVNEAGGGLPPGMSEETKRAAIERLVPRIDWRQQLAVELRTAFEQRADEAEEYSFRRPSRRQASFPEAVLPGTFRPVPQLAVVVDVSSSMDGPKVVAAMTEVHGILQRLAIPVFTVYPTNRDVLGEFTVESEQDVQRIFERIGGGTDMMVGLHHAAQRGAEVIVCLTDMDCDWDDRFVAGIPVLIGGIDARRKAPSWARLIHVRDAADLAQQQP